MPGEAVHVSDPLSVTTPDYVSNKSRVDVTIGEYQVTCPQQREYLPFIAVREICAMNQRESGWCKEPLLLAPSSGFLH